MSSVAARPIEVTAVAVLVFVQAVLEAFGGTGFIVAGSVTQEVTVQGTSLPAPLLITVGAVSLLVAVIGVLVGVGLLRGSNVARMVVTILQVVSVALSVIGFFAAAHGQLASDVLSIAVAVVILVFLWSARSGAFFGSKQSDAASFA